MKKIVSVLLAAVMLCGITGCSNKAALSPDFEIELIGQTVTLPCKVKDIKGIEINIGEQSVSSFQRDNGEYMSTAFFYYNGECAGGIFLDGDCTNKSDLSEEKVVGLKINENVIPMSYKGLKLGSDGKNITDKFGDCDLGGDYVLNYYIEPEGSVQFLLNSEFKIKYILLFVDMR